MSFDITLAHTALHPKSYSYFSLFPKYYKLDQDFEFFFNSFKLGIQFMLHLLASDPFTMFFNTFKNVFTQKI